MDKINAQHPLLLNGFEGELCTYEGYDCVVAKAELHLLENGQRRIKVFLENGKHFWGEVMKCPRPPANEPVAVALNFVEYPSTVKWNTENT